MAYVSQPDQVVKKGEQKVMTDDCHTSQGTRGKELAATARVHSYSYLAIINPLVNPLVNPLLPFRREYEWPGTLVWMIVHDA